MIFDIDLAEDKINKIEDMYGKRFGDRFEALLNK